MRSICVAMLAALGLLAALLLSAPVSAAATYYVATTGSDSNPGTSTAPWRTLQHAEDTVASGDTVIVKGGTYTEAVVFDERWTTTTTFRAHGALRTRLRFNDIVVKINGATNLRMSGFDITSSAPNPGAALVHIDKGNGLPAANITLAGNIIHDAKASVAGRGDLLKAAESVRNLTLDSNIFYNQAGGEEHLDLNSVDGAVVEDSVFFNDYAASGRTQPTDTHSFITVKDSLGDTDGLLGSRNIRVQRNVFANWQGGEGQSMAIQVGNDGKPYHEAVGVTVENNLVLGNSAQRAFTAFGVKGAKDVRFNHNTVTGDLPNAGGYAGFVSVSGTNPPNENVQFTNNIWSDATGTLGTRADGTTRFGTGSSTGTTGLLLDYNLYFNNGSPLPSTGLFYPSQDAHGVTGNAGLNRNHSNVVEPWYNFSTKRFASGRAASATALAEEHRALVDAYAAIPSTSPAVGAANDTQCPTTDIRGRTRVARDCDLGAVEYGA